MDIKIITNNHFRNLLYGYELTAKEVNEFDYIDDITSHNFFRYRGTVYDPDEFMPTPCDEPARQDLNQLCGWDGYQSDSAFSGVVIKYSADFEQVKVGLYLS